MPKITRNVKSDRQLSPFVRHILRHPDASEVRAAFDRCKRWPVMDNTLPVAQGQLEGLRALARVMTELASDRPQARAFLDAVGIPAEALPARFMSNMSAVLLERAEGIETHELVIPWHEWRDERPKTASDGINTVRLSDVAPEDVQWLWPGRIPAGMLTLIVGDPNVGKTWLSLDTVARITTGRQFCDGTSPGQPRDVLWITAEDSLAHTIRPRIDALRGDAQRVQCLTFVQDAKTKKEQALALDRHLAELEQWLDKHPLVSCVFIDPISAFMGKADSNGNSDVRSVLGPVSKIAERRGVGVVGISHMNKGGAGPAMYRGIGSIGFNAAARAVWHACADPAQAGRTLFLPVKMNVAAMPRGLAYSVPEGGGVLWEKEEVEETADGVLQAAARASKGEGEASASARDKAKKWILETLKDGPMPAADVWAKFDADGGMSKRTVSTAKEELGVVTTKEGDRWMWALPT